MLQGMKIAAAAAVAGALALGAGVAGAADYGKKEFTVVGTWSFPDSLKERALKERAGEVLFEKLPEATGGALTANAKPYDQFGLSGYESMRLLKLGTYDAVHGVTTYVAQDSPAIEGTDVAGIIQTWDKGRWLLAYGRCPPIPKPGSICERCQMNPQLPICAVVRSKRNAEKWSANLEDRTGVAGESFKGLKPRIYGLGNLVFNVAGVSAVQLPGAETLPGAPLIKEAMKLNKMETFPDYPPIPFPFPMPYRPGEAPAS